ncbi:hypothetical protein ACH5RR_025560 [Cinchona calisaya]|uniref:Poly [ADP-ribose] polymerase n=1 Tax=Cinchona calisaya TaxID=153742 RepID=A0ABD2Z140_9GENT
MSVMESNMPSRVLSVPLGTRKDGNPHGFKALAPNTTKTPLFVKNLNLSNNQDNIMSSSEPNSADQELVSDCESGTSGTCFGESLGLFDHKLIRIDEKDKKHQFIKHSFLSGLNKQGLHTKVEAIHKIDISSSFTAQARFQTFSIFSQAIEKETQGNANIMHSWYGASKEEIKNIFLHGFGNNLNNGTYGRGIYLSPFDSPLESMKSSVLDEDGLMHLVLCRVILGRMEVVHPGSEQSHPSSEKFDSGVDNLSSPKKYIVWSTHMNNLIFPEFVVSFRSPSNLKDPSRLPNSPWMPFSRLISELSKFLPPDSVKVIQKHYKNHKENKITRQELIGLVRRIAGDQLLVFAIKSYRDEIDTVRRFSPKNNPKKCQKQHGRA